MTVYFADTSAVAKRYLSTEIGSAWMRGIARHSTGNQIAISELTMIEFYSVIARRQRENVLSATAAQRAIRLFLSHIRGEYTLIHLNSRLVFRARKLVTKHGLRTLDAIQLGCALEAKGAIKQPLIFLSSDNKLLMIAAAEKCATDNPLAHP